jgi:hypothetical protein
MCSKGKGDRKGDFPQGVDSSVEGTKALYPR